jgi:hypothetical protein
MTIEEMDKIVNESVNEDFYKQTVEEFENVYQDNIEKYSGSALELSLKELKTTKKEIFLSSIKNLCYLLLFCEGISRSCSFHLTCFKEAGVMRRNGYHASEAENFVIIINSVFIIKIFILIIEIIINFLK